MWPPTQSSRRKLGPSMLRGVGAGRESIDNAAHAGTRPPPGRRGGKMALVHLDGETLQKRNVIGTTRKRWPPIHGGQPPSRCFPTLPDRRPFHPFRGTVFQSSLSPLWRSVHLGLLTPRSPIHRVIPAKAGMTLWMGWNASWVGERNVGRPRRTLPAKEKRGPHGWESPTPFRPPPRHPLGRKCSPPKPDTRPTRSPHPWPRRCGAPGRLA